MALILSFTIAFTIVTRRTRTSRILLIAKETISMEQRVLGNVGVAGVEKQRYIMGTSHLMVVFFPPLKPRRTLRGLYKQK